MTRPASAKRPEPGLAQGPFAEAAHELREHFLCPIPLGGEDGKKTLVKWRNQKNLPSPGYIDNLIGRYPDANVGILCGPSCVTVIDIDVPGICDDAQQLQSYIDRFGETPLITSTPSGGVHLWYKSNGERKPNLRAHGLPIDVLGIGGVVVVPPSVRPSGDHAGLTYRFLVGGWMDLHRLSPLKHGSLSSDTIEQFPSPGPEGLIPKGMRDDSLFYYLKDQAPHLDDEEGLLDVGRTFNMNCEPPLSDAQVQKTVRSVWGYFERGKLLIKGGPPYVRLTGGKDGVLPILYQNPDALALYCKLIEAHAAREGPFKIQAKAMARKRVIAAFKKTHQRYANARDFLLVNKLIIKVHAGKGRIFRDGEFKPDPDLFTFPSTPGPKSGPYITNTPPPWGYGDKQ